MLSAEEEADKTAQQRDTHTERDKFERTYQRDVLFLGCERSCRHISARIDTRDCNKEDTRELIFWIFLSYIVAFSVAKNAHK